VSASQATPLAASGRSERTSGSDQPSPARPAGPPTQSAAPPTQPNNEAKPAGPASLSLRLHIDFASRKATVAVDDGQEPLQLEFDGDAWRPASAS
jgi:hypothetical protein